MTNSFKMEKTKKNMLIQQLKNNLPNPKCFTQAFFLKTELFLLSLLLFYFLHKNNAAYNRNGKIYHNDAKKIQGCHRLPCAKNCLLKTGRSIKLED